MITYIPWEFYFSQKREGVDADDEKVVILDAGGWYAKEPKPLLEGKTYYLSRDRHNLHVDHYF